MFRWLRKYIDKRVDIRLQALGYPLEDKSGNRQVFKPPTNENAEYLKSLSGRES